MPTRPPDWTQAHADGLHRIAEEAVAAAARDRGCWVNPLTPLLMTRVRCVDSFGEVWRCHEELGLPTPLVGDFLDAFIEAVPSLAVVDEFSAHDLLDHLDAYHPAGVYLIVSPTFPGVRVRFDSADVARQLRYAWGDEASTFDPPAFAQFSARIDVGAEERREMILERRHYTEPATMPGFRRFYSIDPRFPFSICYPVRGSVQSDTSHRERQIVEFDTFTVRRHLLVEFDNRWTGDPTIPLKVFKDPAAFVRYQFDGPGRGPWSDLGYRIADKPEEMTTVGSGCDVFRAPRVIGGRKETAFEWVFFGRESRPEVWIIAREYQTMSDDDFHTVVASFRWLDLAFFRSLPALPSDFAYHVEPGLLPTVSAGDQPEEALKRIAIGTIAPARRFPHAPENAQRIMDGKEPDWIQPVDGLRSAICYVAPGVFYIRHEDHALVGEERIHERAAQELGEALWEECRNLQRHDSQRYGMVLRQIERTLQNETRR